MKLLPILAGTVVVALAGRAVLTLRGNRLVERALGTLATVQVPARLEPWGPRTNWLGTHYRLSRFMNSIRAMGSSTPTHEDLLVSQLVPAQAARLGDGVVRHLSGAFEHVEDVAWEPAVAEGAVSRRVGTARYTPNGLDEPAWLVEVMDRERGLVVGYRGLKRQLSRDRAVALAETALSSYRLVTGVATWFAAVPRDLDGDVTLSLPVEFFDPFMMEADSSGVRWMLFRHHPEAVEDRTLLERALAVAAFFAPGDAAQARAARDILRREALREATIMEEQEAGADGLTVALARHETAGRTEEAWLVTGFDAARGVGVTARLWRRDATREEAVAIVTQALASYRFVGDSAWFAPAGGTP